MGCAERFGPRSPRRDPSRRGDPPRTVERGAIWHGLPHRGSWDLIAAIRLRLLLRRLHADVCIAHGNRAMSCWAGRGKPADRVLPNYKMRCRGAAAVFHQPLT